MDRASGAVVLCLGILVLWQGRDLPVGSLAAAGPGFFPTVIALSLMGLSFFLILPKVAGNAAEPGFTRPGIARVALVFGVLVGYFLLLERLGFLVTTFLLLSLLFIGGAARRWHSAVLAASLVTGAAYGLFQILLKSDLPKGVLGF